MIDMANYNTYIPSTDQDHIIQKEEGMIEPPSQPFEGPASQNVEEFEKKLSHKKSKNRKKEIDQIQSYNQKEVKYQHNRKQEQDEFSAEAWGEQEQGQVDFFEEEGRDLIREGPSRKKLPVAPMLVALALHVGCLVGKVALVKLVWLWYAIDLALIVIHLAVLADTKCASKRFDGIYFVYHYLLICSIFLSAFFACYEFYLLTDSSTPKLPKIALAIASLLLAYFQLMIFHLNRRLRWMQSQLNKRSPDLANNQTLP